MNTAVATSPQNKPVKTSPSAIQIMASRYSVDPVKLYETLRKSIFPKATEEEMLALIVIANEYKLNVMLRELFAFPAKGGGVVPVVSVDGWNTLLIRQPDFDGIKFQDNNDADGNLISCTATIYVKGRTHPTEITEYLVECKRNTDPWNNMPHRMLRNRTLCQASRVAFGFSGIKHEEDIDGAITIESTVISSSQQSEIPKKIVAADSKTPQVELEALTIAAGYSFDLVQKWGEESGMIEGSSSLAAFAEIPTDVAKRILKAQAGYLKALETLKGAA